MASRDQQLANMKNTTCRPTKDGGFEMTYHQTRVFRSKPVKHGAQIHLRTGGYRTDTTKRRINWCFDKAEIPVQLYQKDRRWFISLRQADGTQEDVEFLENSATMRVSENAGIWTMLIGTHA